MGIAVESATDVAKGCASVILTPPGINGIVDLISSSRNIHRRILTWTMNKILKAFQTNVIICALFVYKKVILDEKHLIYSLFLLDLVTLSLATDNVCLSCDFSVKSQIGKIIIMCSAMELISIFEFIILYESLIGILDFQEQQTATFNMLFFYGILHVFCFQEKGLCWSSKPGRDLVIAVLLDFFLVLILVHTSIVDIQAVEVSLTLLIFSYNIV